MRLLHRWREQLGLHLLAAVVAVASLLGGVGTASEAAGRSAETRVGAFADSAAARVGPAERIAASQGRRHVPDLVGSVVATGVAANAPARFAVQGVGGGGGHGVPGLSGLSARPLRAAQFTISIFPRPHVAPRACRSYRVAIGPGTILGAPMIHLDRVR